MGNLEKPVSVLSGVGVRTAAAFEKLSIRTLGELLRHFPTRYENRGVVTALADGVPGKPQSYILTVASQPNRARLPGGRTIVRFRAFDSSASAEIAYFNQPYVKDKFQVGETYRFYGSLCARAGRFSLASPTAERYFENVPLPELYPVYRLAAGLNKRILRDCVRKALELCKNEIPEPLPAEIRASYNLAAAVYAMENIHMPESLAALDRAARRIAFDELFEAAVAARLQRGSRLRAHALRMRDADPSPFYAALPFAPTGAQRRTIAEIAGDLCAGMGEDAPRMSRIVVGDVGSGKTVCAAAALFFAVRSGAQAAMLAPTEILAEQHYATLSTLFAPFGFVCGKLTGGMTAAAKRRVKEALADGTIQIVVGTHALLEEDVRFSQLGLVIADEQQRFGVRQRAALLERAPRAHMLVMSATPIPRTLALVLYGDLDISRVDELPPGRKPVETFLVDERYRARLNAFIEKQVADGGQVYVVCPAVEQPQDDAEAGAQMVGVFGGALPEEAPVHSAVEHAKTLAARFPQYTVACMHGRLRAAEKQAVMTRFAAGEIHILVSTTVIEVGVDVPNAVLMIIENAERFGLSQIHQLRGRVGRGKRKSYCILVSDSKSERARERLRFLCSSTDGFAIAEQDLKMRGPGDLLCASDARQSGEEKQFRMSALCNDSRLFEEASEAASRLLADNPSLAGEALASLRARVSSVLESAGSTIN